ncbi:MAG: carbohydrate porin [Candidatus Binataceae bacterium]
MYGIDSSPSPQAVSRRHQDPSHPATEAAHSIQCTRVIILALLLIWAGFARAASPAIESGSNLSFAALDVFSTSPSDQNPPVVISQPHTMPPEKTSIEETATGAWWGVRDQLQNDGIWLGATWVMEGFQNFRGGIDTEPTVMASTTTAHVGLDLHKLFGWPGGEVYLDLQDHGGRNPSHLLVGDLQIFDKFNSAPFLQIDEFWYQQELFAGALRVKIGKVDANTEFSVIDNGLPFLSSSTQVSPTIFVFPTFPDPMPSINVFFTPNEPFYASFGAYYANKSDHALDFFGRPYEAQHSTGGTLFLGETGTFWHEAPWLGHDGNLRLGIWGHTGTFKRFDRSHQHGAMGFYTIGNQTLWQPRADDRGVRMFLEFAHAQRSVSPIDWHGGGGFTWTGLIRFRPHDIIGFSPQYVHLSDENGFTYSYEAALEVFYQMKLTPWFRIQPDLQYIIHPGGRHPNALMGTLRLGLDL